MTTSERSPKDDLRSRLDDPGFTPPVRRLGELLDLVSNDDEAVVKLAERGVLKIEAQFAERVIDEVVKRTRASTRPTKGRLTRIVGRLAESARDPQGVGVRWLEEALADEDPKTRRVAAIHLGKLAPSPTIAAALASAFDRAAAEEDRKVLAEALGKVGGDAGRARLANGEYARAALIANREHARGKPSAIDPSRVGRNTPIWFHTRSGLEPILEEELGSRFGTPKFVFPGVVGATLGGPLATAIAVRTADHIGFPVGPFDRKGELADDLARALQSPEALAIFRAWTVREADEPIRFRIAFLTGGHRRPVVWQTAELIHQQTREILNDPTESTWQVVVSDVGNKIALELVPRRVADERFDYRKDLVAASSHPTIAAALARMAPQDPSDVVWDPFVGAGAELVERAKLGAYTRLIGSDLEPAAIAAARANLERAGIQGAVLEEADACTYEPEGVSLIITNPPMGRRVSRGTHAELLERFVAHAAKVLIPGGALVWLVPEPERIRVAAERAKLVPMSGRSVDMGGFSAELAVYVKPRPRRHVRPRG